MRLPVSIGLCLCLVDVLSAQTWKRENPLTPVRGQKLGPLNSASPVVRFECQGRGGGYYGDMDFGCSIFHYCTAAGTRYTFKCGKGLKFNEMTTTCSAGFFGDCTHPEIVGSAGRNMSAEPAPVKSFQNIPVFKGEENSFEDDPRDYPEPFIQHYDPALDLDYDYYEPEGLDPAIQDAQPAASNILPSSSYLKRESNWESALSSFASLANMPLDSQSNAKDRIDRMDNLEPVEYINNIDRAFLARPPPRRSIIQRESARPLGKRPAFKNNLIKSPGINGFRRQRPNLIPVNPPPLFPVPPNDHFSSQQDYIDDSVSGSQYQNSIPYDSEDTHVLEEAYGLGETYLSEENNSHQTTPDTFRPSSLLTDDPEEFQPVTSKSEKELPEHKRPYRQTNPPPNGRPFSSNFQSFDPSGNFGPTRFPSHISFGGPPPSPPTSQRVFNPTSNGFLPAPNIPPSGNFVFNQPPIHPKIFNTPFRSVAPQSRPSFSGPRPLTHQGPTFNQPPPAHHTQFISHRPPPPPAPSTQIHSFGPPSGDRAIQRPPHHLQNDQPFNQGNSFIHAPNQRPLTSNPSHTIVHHTTPSSVHTFSTPSIPNTFHSQSLNRPTPPPRGFLTTLPSSLNSGPQNPFGFQHERPLLESFPNIVQQSTEVSVPDLSDISPKVPFQGFPPFPSTTTKQTFPPFSATTTKQAFPTFPTTTPKQVFPPFPTTTPKQGFPPFPTGTPKQRFPPFPTTTLSSLRTPVTLDAAIGVQKEPDVLSPEIPRSPGRLRPAFDPRPNRRRRPVTNFPVTPGTLSLTSLSQLPLTTATERPVPFTRQPVSLSKRPPSRNLRKNIAGSSLPSARPTLLTGLENSQFNNPFLDSSRNRPGSQQLGSGTDDTYTFFDDTQLRETESSLSDDFATSDEFEAQHTDTADDGIDKTLGVGNIIPGKVEDSSNFVEYENDYDDVPDVITAKPTTTQSTTTQSTPTKLKRPVLRRRPGIRNRLRNQLASRTRTTPVPGPSDKDDFDNEENNPEDNSHTSEDPPATTLSPFRQRVRDRLNSLREENQHGTKIASTTAEPPLEDVLEETDTTLESTTAAPTKATTTKRPTNLRGLSSDRIQRYRNRLRSRLRTRTSRTTTTTEKPTKSEDASEDAAVKRPSPSSSLLTRLKNRRPNPIRPLANNPSPDDKKGMDDIPLGKTALDDDIPLDKDLESDQETAETSQTIVKEPLPSSDLLQVDNGKVIQDEALPADQDVREFKPLVKEDTTIDITQEDAVEEISEHNKEEQPSDGASKRRRIINPNFRARFREFIKNRKHKMTANHTTTEEPVKQEEETSITESTTVKPAETPTLSLKERMQQFNKNRDSIRQRFLVNRQKQNGERLSRKIPVRPLRNKLLGAKANEDSSKSDESQDEVSETREVKESSNDHQENIKNQRLPNLPQKIPSLPISKVTDGFTPALNPIHVASLPKDVTPSVEEIEIITAPTPIGAEEPLFSVEVSSTLNGQPNVKPDEEKIVPLIAFDEPIVISVEEDDLIPDSESEAMQVASDEGIVSPQEAISSEPDFIETKSDHSSDVLHVADEQPATSSDNNGGPFEDSKDNSAVLVGSNEPEEHGVSVELIGETNTPSQGAESYLPESREDAIPSYLPSSDNANDSPDKLENNALPQEEVEILPQEEVEILPQEEVEILPQEEIEILPQGEKVKSIKTGSPLNFEIPIDVSVQRQSDERIDPLGSPPDTNNQQEILESNSDQDIHTSKINDEDVQVSSAEESDTALVEETISESKPPKVSKPIFHLRGSSSKPDREISAISASDFSEELPYNAKAVSLIPITMATDPPRLPLEDLLLPLFRR